MFRFAIVFMLLGLVRHLVLTLLSVRRALHSAADKAVPYRQIAKATLAWLFPFTKLRNRVVYSALSIAFHVGIIITPIFLVGHIALWRRGLGFGWPAIGNTLADVLTIVALVTVVGLIVGRLWTRESRTLTRPSDIVLLILIALPFGSGFLVSHPLLNPFGLNGTLLVHVMTANLIMILMPITKLSHVVLLPTTQLVSDVAWRFPPDAGEKVFNALHPRQQEGS